MGEDVDAKSKRADKEPPAQPESDIVVFQKVNLIEKLAWSYLATVRECIVGNLILRQRTVQRRQGLYLPPVTFVLCSYVAAFCVLLVVTRGDIGKLVKDFAEPASLVAQHASVVLGTGLLTVLFICTLALCASATALQRLLLGTIAFGGGWSVGTSMLSTFIESLLGKPEHSTSHARAAAWVYAALAVWLVGSSVFFGMAPSSVRPHPLKVFVRQEWNRRELRRLKIHLKTSCVELSAIGCALSAFALVRFFPRWRWAGDLGAFGILALLVLLGQVLARTTRRARARAFTLAAYYCGLTLALSVLNLPLIAIWIKMARGLDGDAPPSSLFTTIAGLMIVSQVALQTATSRFRSNTGFYGLVAVSVWGTAVFGATISSAWAAVDPRHTKAGYIFRQERDWYFFDCNTGNTRKLLSTKGTQEWRAVAEASKDCPMQPVGSPNSAEPDVPWSCPTSLVAVTVNGTIEAADGLIVTGALALVKDNAKFCDALQSVQAVGRARD